MLGNKFAFSSLDTLALKDDNLQLKKTLKLQEAQLKKHQVTIRRLEKISIEKDKLQMVLRSGVYN